MTIRDLVTQAGEGSLAKGFTSAVETGTRLMLIVSELSEALEADRKKRNASLKDYLNDIANPAYSSLTEAEYDQACHSHFEHRIKDTFEDEIADAVIRLGDLCFRYGIDLETYVKLKLEYNRLRPYKHGKEY